MGCLEDIEMAEKEQGEPFRLVKWTLTRTT